jgi:hypothetical protein
MADEIKRKDITILLADYMNILPPGPQTAYVPAGDNFGAEESWPMTPELEARMDTNSIIGETYATLEYALAELDKEHPEWYNGVLSVFLHPEAGHSDIEFLRRQNPKNITLLCADEGVNWLADFINDEDIFVRRASVSDTSRSEQHMEHKYDEVAAAFIRYRESGVKASDALKNLFLKYSKDFGETRIRTIVKERVPSDWR